MDEIVQYLEHIDVQESALKPGEQQKETFKNSFFGDKDKQSKDNKDDSLYYTNNQ